MRRALWLCLLPSLAGCGSGPGRGDEIVLGAAMPLSGKHAKAGGLYRMGYELAVAEANAAGGVLVGDRRLPVRLVVYDDKSDGATAVNLIERLVNVDGVHALLSGYSTPLVQAQVVVPAKYGVPYLNAGGASQPIFREGNRWIFGLLSSVENLAESTIEWLVAEQARGRLPRPMRIALAWQNTDHGREYRAGVERALARHEGELVLVLDESFEHLGKDHTSLIVKVKAADADVFLSDAHEPDYVLQHRAYVEQGLSHLVTSYGARGPEESARTALGDRVDHLISAQWWSPVLNYPLSRHFVQAFEEAYGEPPTEFYSALGYEGARSLLVAIEKAGSLERGAIRDALASLDIESLLPGGRVSFPEENRYQIDNPCVLVQNTPDGGVAIIYPEDAATAEAVIHGPS